MAMEQTRNVIKFPLESCIMIPKEEVINKLAHNLEENSKEPFKLLCKRIETSIKSFHDSEYRELLESYQCLNPRAENEHRSTEIESQEQKFLQKFFQLMEYSKYKLVNDKEWKLATSSQYLLSLSIKIDRTKLDKSLLSNFNVARRFAFSKNQFVIFRQGISIDRSSGYFIFEKLNSLLLSLQTFLISFLCYGGRNEGQEEASYERSNALEAGETRFQSIERFHADDIRLSGLFKRAQLQEPKYEHVVVLYRHSENYGIHIKHYLEVPVADMEIVLPGKKPLRPSVSDVIKFIISAIFGSVMYTVLDRKQHWVGAAILVLCMIYCFKLLISFVAGVWRFKKLLKKKIVRDKRLNKHQGVLVNLFRDAVQQEVKIAIVAFYVLLKRDEGASKEQLCFECEKLMEALFNKNCIFALNDTLVNLQKLQIVFQDSSQKYHHLPLHDANQKLDIEPEASVI